MSGHSHPTESAMDYQTSRALTDEEVDALQEIVLLSFKEV